MQHRNYKRRRVTDPPIISSSSLSLASTWQKSFTSTATQHAMAFPVPTAPPWRPVAPWCAFDSSGETDVTRQRICSGLVWHELSAQGVFGENSRGPHSHIFLCGAEGVKKTAEIQFSKPSLSGLCAHTNSTSHNKLTIYTSNSHICTSSIAAPSKVTNSSAFSVKFPFIFTHISSRFHTWGDSLPS